MEGEQGSNTIKGSYGQGLNHCEDFGRWCSVQRKYLPVAELCITKLKDSTLLQAKDCKCPGRKETSHKLFHEVRARLTGELFQCSFGRRMNWKALEARHKRYNRIPGKSKQFWLLQMYAHFLAIFGRQWPDLANSGQRVLSPQEGEGIPWFYRSLFSASWPEDGDSIPSSDIACKAPKLMTSQRTDVITMGTLRGSSLVWGQNYGFEANFTIKFAQKLDGCHAMSPV